MKIAYIGIDILYPVLPALVEEGCEVMKIFTCRTDNITEFNLRVSHFARVNGIPLQLDRVRRADLEELRDRGCELVISAGYYYIIPCIDGVRMMNVHPAYLPLGRGAWPMPVTILRGLKESGISIHKMTPELDAGDIILKERIDVDPDKDDLQTASERQNALIPGMIHRLMRDFDELWENAKPQGDDFEYWDNPGEADWTVRPQMGYAEADRILRAFYGYACIYDNGKKRYELTWGRAYRDASMIPEDIKGRTFALSDGSVIAAKQVREMKAVRDHGNPVTVSPDIGMKEDIDRIFYKYGHGDSAHSFPSIFMWKDDMDLSVHLEENLYSVRCGWKGSNSWFFPCGSDDAKRSFIGALLETEDPSFCYMTEEDRDFLIREFPGTFSVEETPDDSEYIYDRQEMVEMKGGRHARTRAYIHSLEREHAVSWEPVSKDNFDQMLEISRQWVRSSEEASQVTDDHAARNFFDHWDGFNAGGVIVYVDGEPMAMAVGFLLTDDCFDCTLQQSTDNIQGLAGYLHAAFAKNAPEGVSFLNWEEDLGLQGLRMMKRQRMCPCRMITMYRGFIES